MNRNEEEIRNQRTREAIQRNLMGKSGKLGAVSIILGEPILGQSGDDIEFYNDPWDSGDDDIGTFREDAGVVLLGWIWDGLREGINMEIKLTGFGPDITDPRAFIMDELKVTFDGYLVYHEEHGILQCYTPTHPVVGSWEHHVDVMYERARKRRTKQDKAVEKQNKEDAPKLAERILNMLKFKWGE